MTLEYEMDPVTATVGFKGVMHSVPNTDDLSAVNLSQLLNLLGEKTTHPGINQTRVGTVTTTILDTIIVVTFGTAMPDADYEVFIQANANVGVSAYPSNFTATGFTLNLSAGVNANFSYLAVENA